MLESILGLRTSVFQYVLMVSGLISLGYFLFRLITNYAEHKLAIRNIIRNTRRTITTILAITIAIASSVLIGNYFLDMFDGLRETTINSELGHLQIMKDGFLEEGASSPADYLFENYDEMIHTIITDPELKDYIHYIATEINFQGIVIGPSGEKSINYLGRASDVAYPKNNDEIGQGNFTDVYIKGKALDTSVFDGVVLGEGLASQLKVSVDDYLTIMATTEGGGFDILDAKLEGIISTFSRAYGNVILKTNMDFAQELLGVNGANKLVLYLNETRMTEEAYKKLQEIVSQHPEWQARAYSWYELSDFYPQVQRMFSNIYIIVSTVLFIIAVFFILNTVSMSVYERFSEFGTLRSIGLKKNSLVSLVVIEGAYLGIIGSILGMILVFILAQIITSAHITLSPPPGYARGYPLDLLVYPQFDYVLLILKSVLGCFGVAIFATIFPAHKAANLKIIDCIRTQ